MSSQSQASFLAVRKWGRRKGIELHPERWPILVTERSRKLQVNNSLSCQLCVMFHPWSWGWKGDQALASYSSGPTGTSNRLFVVDLLTNNMRAWTMVHEHRSKFRRFKLSQDWEDISISSPRFFPIKCGAFLPPPFNPKEVFHVKCKEV